VLLRKKVYEVREGTGYEVVDGKGYGIQVLYLIEYNTIIYYIKS